MSVKIETLLFAIVCLFGTVPAFAEADWILVETDKMQYHTGQDMEVSGYILEQKMPVVATSIYDPDGGILAAYNVELEADGGFSKTVSLDSPFYDKSGLYVIEFKYGPKTDSVFFEIIGSSTVHEPEPKAKVIPEVLSLSTDKSSYSDSDTITISGEVSAIGDPTILVGIYDPDNFPAGFYTPEITSDLKFSVSFLAKEGVNFKAIGTYSIKAHYGQSKQSTTFAFVENTSHSKPLDSKPDKKPEPPKITINPAQPKSEDKTVQKPIQSTNPPQKIPHVTNQPSPKPDTKQVVVDDLTPEEKEIGKLLNEITLSCDNDHYTDAIVHSEGMGAALMKLCSYDQALSHFDKVLAKDENNIEVITNKAVVLNRLGQVDLALEHYNLALKLEPDFIPALNNKANLLAEIGQLEKAITIYNKILDQDPSYIIAQENLQKAKDDLVQYTELQQEESSEYQPVSETEEPVIETEPPQTYQEPKESSNVIEQIGGFFAGLFGFLR